MIREADPKLLIEATAPLNPEEIKNIFYSVLQDKYEKKDLSKLKATLGKIYPKTQK